MDVMSPDLLWIGDRCYRLPALGDSALDNLSRNETYEQDIPVEFTEKTVDFEDDEVENLIEVLPDGRYKLSLPISQTFLSKIIGTKGVTKKRIESDTNTTIMIPRLMEQGDVIIRGTMKSSIVLAKKSIDAIVFASRQKLVFTHFISVPMNSSEIKENFISFKGQVLKLCGTDRGIDESIFQNPEKLHLTMGTLVLTDKSERNVAEELLKDVYEKSLKPLISNHKNCQLEMKGIEYMNDDPAEVNVLYAKVTSKGNNDLIQKIADQILQHFSKHKLLKSDDKEEVKLHVTLMNTLFREEAPEEMDIEVEGSGRNKWNKKTRRTFNAVNVLQNFQDFYFGQQEFKSIHLSVRFSTDKDGYYKSSCVLNI